MATLRLEEIASRIGGSVEGDSALEILRVAPLSDAQAGDLTYCDGRKQKAALQETSASAVIVAEGFDVGRDDLAVIRCRQPVVAWAAAVELFHPRKRRYRDVSPQAVLGTDVALGEDVGIAPGVVVGDRVRLGARVEIGPGSTIGDDVTIDDDTVLWAGVHVYHDTRIGARCIVHAGVVIGGDGYGFTQEATGDEAEPVRHRKIPQVGNVIIEDDVEVGANSTIDRGALGPTVIGRGTKIDNLVMIAHNCRIGPHSLVIAQVGLSGSVRTGPYVTIAGQAGVAGHLEIGARAIIGAQTGIMKDVPAGEIWVGSPAYPAALARRAYAQIEHLPDFRKRIQELEEKVAALEGGASDDAPDGDRASS